MTHEAMLIKLKSIRDAILKIEKNYILNKIPENEIADFNKYKNIFLGIHFVLKNHYPDYFTGLVLVKNENYLLVLKEATSTYARTEADVKYYRLELLKNCVVDIEFCIQILEALHDYKLSWPVEAVFSNIAARIIKEIDQAQTDILVASAWFTNSELLRKLLEKAKSGVNVAVLIDSAEENFKATDYFERLIEAEAGISVFKSEENSVMMHNKFCVIDSTTTITGSFNWSFLARNNHENILIIKDNKEIAQEYLIEFQNIQENCIEFDEYLKTLKDSKTVITEENPSN